MALLIALALFAAQAVNFGLALRDRREFRLAQATRPAAIRIADALEREAQGGRSIQPDRGRVRRVAADPVPAAADRRHAEVPGELRLQLADLGVRAGRIDIGLVPRPAVDELRRAENRGRDRPELLMIAVEQPGRGWIVVYAPWVQFGSRLLAALLIQTLILYVVILFPVLWIARRLSLPLRDLTAAAGSFDPHARGEPVVPAGPDDLRRLVDAFNALRLRVTAMLDEKDRMLGAIGHDLRTPLAALRVRIESVEDETDRARMADTVIEMDRTLDDILSLARIGRPSEPPVEVDLAALVDAVVDDFHALGADVTLADSGRVRVRLRPNLMRRAVRNLIENAVKYGGGAAVRLEEPPGGVAVVVEDEGPGIPADRLAGVFDPFVRLEESRNRDTGGVGLGLALARSIVREAGGDIRLANRPGGGLAATISLPR
ncbi:sensor histidine kinase [Sphingomonas sp.]|uniref:sensor histidine kinase n=1 Tax=Sphingomonas sp. TaxID=28214 RepID=UPI003CC62C1C